jgi:hypothetical protein
MGTGKQTFFFMNELARSAVLAACVLGALPTDTPFAPGLSDLLLSLDSSYQAHSALVV